MRTRMIPVGGQRSTPQASHLSGKLTPVADDVRTQAKATRRWYLWEGSPSNLARVAQDVEDLIRPRRASAVNEVAERWRNSDPEGLCAIEMQREVDRTNESWEVEMTAIEPLFDTKHVGPPAKVLERVSGLSLSSVSISAPSDAYSMPRVVVRFDRSAGCALLAEGDPHWVRSAHSLLSDSLARGVPWWAVARSIPFALIVTTLIAVTFPLAYMRTEKLETFEGFAIGCMSTVLAFLLNDSMKRLFPGFELVPEGGRSRGARRIAVVGALGVGIVGSLLAALLLAL